MLNRSDPFTVREIFQEILEAETMVDDNVEQVIQNRVIRCSKLISVSSTYKGNHGNHHVQFNDRDGMLLSFRMQLKLFKATNTSVVDGFGFTS